MDKKRIAAEFRTAARALQKWVLQHMNILTFDYASQRELQRLIREVDARATLLEFRFPDVDLTGFSISPLRYWGWCRVPYFLAKTGKDGQLVDCFSLACGGEWSKAIDGLVTAADLVSGDIENPSSLPFNLQRCDVPQTLKRKGHNPVSIHNADYWKLLEALMAAAPNAVAESKLKQLFPYPHGRDNARKKLCDIIDSLGLTVKNWVLMELKN